MRRTAPVSGAAGNFCDASGRELTQVAPALATPSGALTGCRHGGVPGPSPGSGATYPCVTSSCIFHEQARDLAEMREDGKHSGISMEAPRVSWPMVFARKYGYDRTHECIRSAGLPAIGARLAASRLTAVTG